MFYIYIKKTTRLYVGVRTEDGDIAGYSPAFSVGQQSHSITTLFFLFCLHTDHN